MTIPVAVLIISLLTVLVSLLTPKIPAQIIRLAEIAFAASLLVVLYLNATKAVI